VSTNPATAYEPPRILAVVAADPTVTNTSALSANGGQELLLLGLNFGPGNASVEGFNESFVLLQEVSYGASGSEYTPIVFRTLNHTAISLVTAPCVGRNLVFVVTVAGQTSEVRAFRWGLFSIRMVLPRRCTHVVVVVAGGDVVAGVTAAALRLALMRVLY
jgi:hypothetical protein